MRFSLAHDLTTNKILDANIHRLIRLSEELSNDPEYSIILRFSDPDYVLTVLNQGNPLFSINCNGVQTPDNLLVPIVQSGSNMQQITTLTEAVHRIVNMGVDVCTDAGKSVTFISDMNDGVTTDYLLVSTSTSIDKIEVGGAGWKIPPHTGLHK